MRDEFEPRSVTMGGNIAAKNYTMEASPKAFKALMGGLYSWPEAAAVRELCTNAFDSHVEAGKRDVPFEVHLPTYDDPYFRVRDYGVGMSREVATEVTTTFFRSTKEDSNEAVGRHGLGCKVPLAISDTMTLVVYTGTERWTFITTLDENHKPQQVEFEPVPDDSERGVEFSFPVDASRFDSFANAATLIFQGFDVQPVFTGGDPAPMNQASVIYETEGFRIYDLQPSYRKVETAYARQGCVLYPLDIDAIRSAQIDGVYGDEGRVTEEEEWVLSTTAEIDFDIGELSVPLSREGLEYNKRTLANIIRKVKSIHERAVEYVKSTLKGVRSPVQLHKALRNARDIVPSFDVKPVNMGRFKITTRRITTTVKTGQTYFLKEKPLFYVLRRTSGRYLKMDLLPKTLEITPTSKTFYYFKPTSKNRAFISKINYAMEGVYGRKAVDYIFVIPHEVGSPAFKRAHVLLGRPDLSEMTDVATLPSKTRSSAGFANPPETLKVNRPFYTTKRTFVDEDFDPANGGVFIRSKGSEFLNHDETGSLGLGTNQLVEMMQILKKAGKLTNPLTGEDVDEIVIFNGRHQKVIDSVEEGSWVNILDLIKQHQEEVVSEVCQDYYTASEHRDFNRSLSQNSVYFPVAVLSMLYYNDLMSFDMPNTHEKLNKIRYLQAVAFVPSNYLFNELSEKYEFCSRADSIFKTDYVKRAWDDFVATRLSMKDVEDMLADIAQDLKDRFPSLGLIFEAARQGENYSTWSLRDVINKNFDENTTAIVETMKILDNERRMVDNPPQLMFSPTRSNQEEVA